MGEKQQKQAISGKFHYGLAPCFEQGFGNGLFNIVGSSTWTIPGGNASDCFNFSFEEEGKLLSSCDMAYLGFSYESGPEGDVRTFAVTYRWDVEGQVF